MRKLFICISLIFVSAAVSSCRKDIGPPDENSVPKVLIKQITSKIDWTEKPMQNRTQQLVFEYNAANQLIKITQHLSDLPANAFVLDDGAYETFEYNGDTLLRHNLYKRMGRDPTNPLELYQYYEYAYDNDGRISNTVQYDYLQITPGQLDFRATMKRKFTYTNGQLSDLKIYYMKYYNQQPTGERLQTHIRYVYSPDGNLSKSSINWIGVYGQESNLNEVNYTGYDEHVNPAYSINGLSGSLLFYSLLAYNVTGNEFPCAALPFLLSKNNPSEIKEFIYLDGKQPIDAGTPRLWRN